MSKKENKQTHNVMWCKQVIHKFSKSSKGTVTRNASQILDENVYDKLQHKLSLNLGSGI